MRAWNKREKNKEEKRKTNHKASGSNHKSNDAGYIKHAFKNKLNQHKYELSDDRDIYNISRTYQETIKEKIQDLAHETAFIICKR